MDKARENLAILKPIYQNVNFERVRLGEYAQNLRGSFNRN